VIVESEAFDSAAARHGPRTFQQAGQTKEAQASMILSFHPIFSADHFILCSDREPEEKDFTWMRQAEAILLPQHRQEKLYRASRGLCAHVFPNYDVRYAYPGKIGDIRLFHELGLPHPRADLFEVAADCPSDFWEDLEYPKVVKSNHGGEGQLVFLVDSPEQGRSVAGMLANMESSGMHGFLVQEYIITDQRTLRVVVMGNRLLSYWRRQPDVTDFRHNLAAGGEIDAQSDPGLQESGKKLVRRLCELTGINLAGVDLLFPVHQGQVLDQPLLLEINYYFARRGLGGSDRYYLLLKQAIEQWLRSVGIDRPLQD
jgi:ribosomal protein S6--L-glutamate ligase